MYISFRNLLFNINNFLSFTINIFIWNNNYRVGRITLLSVLKIRLFGSQTPKYVQLLVEHCNIRERKNDSLLSDAAASAAAKSLQSCPTLWPHRRQPTRLPRPGDFPGQRAGGVAIAFSDLSDESSQNQIKYVQVYEKNVWKLTNFHWDYLFCITSSDLFLLYCTHHNTIL